MCTSDDLDIQPVCSNGVVTINGLWFWWMPLLVDYVGCLVKCGRSRNSSFFGFGSSRG